MSDGTPNLDLKYLDPSQSQPEVKVNDAWNKLDEAFGQGTGIAVSDLSSPPIVKRALELKFEGATVTHETNGVAHILIDASGSGGGGSPLSVTDGSTTVADVVEILFVNRAAVSDAGGGVAHVVIDPTSGGGGGGGSSNETPDTHPTSPMDADDEFEGVALDTAGTRRAGATAWAWVNQNSATAVLAQGAIKITEHVNAAEDVNFIVQSITTSLAAWRYRAKISALFTAGYNNGGIMLRESATGKICEFGLVNYGGTGELWVEYAAGPTSGGTAAINSSLAGAWPFAIGSASRYLYLEVELASGTIHFRLSPTGLDGSFAEFYSAVATTFFTSVPNQIGLGGYSFNASTAGVLFADWFRQMA